MKKTVSDKLNSNIKLVSWINSKGQKQLTYYLKYTFNNQRRSMKIGNSATPIQVIRKIGAEIEAKML